MPAYAQYQPLSGRFPTLNSGRLRPPPPPGPQQHQPAPILASRCSPCNEIPYSTTTMSLKEPLPLRHLYLFLFSALYPSRTFFPAAPVERRRAEARERECTDIHAHYVYQEVEAPTNTITNIITQQNTSTTYPINVYSLLAPFACKRQKQGKRNLGALWPRFPGQSGRTLVLTSLTHSYVALEDVRSG